jgi:hypothetical protein
MEIIMKIYNQINDSIIEEINSNNGKKIYHVKEYMPMFFYPLGVNKYKTIEAAQKYTDEKLYNNLISCERILCIDCGFWKTAVIAVDDINNKTYCYWFDTPELFEGEIVLCSDEFNSEQEAYEYIINKFNKDSLETTKHFNWNISIFQKMQIISSWLLKNLN